MNAEKIGKESSKQVRRRRGTIRYSDDSFLDNLDLMINKDYFQLTTTTTTMIKITTYHQREQTKGTQIRAVEAACIRDLKGLEYCFDY